MTNFRFNHIIKLDIISPPNKRMQCHFMTTTMRYNCRQHKYIWIFKELQIIEVVITKTKTKITINETLFNPEHLELKIYLTTNEYSNLNYKLQQVYIHCTSIH